MEPQLRYLLISVQFFFFEGTVEPVVRYFWTSSKSGHVCWAFSHDDLVVKGSLHFPDNTSDTEISPTLELHVSFMKLHIEQSCDLQSIGFRLA